MFIGHFGIAFAARRVAPAVSLGTLFLACQLADLVWPVLVIGGVERVAVDPGNTAFTPLAFEHYPYSHSLVTLGAWGGLLGVAYAGLRRASGRMAAVVAVVVWSHWWLDFLTHRPDLPLWPGGSARLGLGLWNSVPGTLLVEGAIFAAGLALYARATRPRDRAGTIGLWALAALLSLITAANVLGPPPPSAAAVVWTANALWLLVAAGYYVDRHREARPVG
jgi:hypothetical protein